LKDSRKELTEKNSGADLRRREKARERVKPPLRAAVRAAIERRRDTVDVDNPLKTASERLTRHAGLLPTAEDRLWDPVVTP
jgi:hypothetical protein